MIEEVVLCSEAVMSIRIDVVEEQVERGRLVETEAVEEVVGLVDVTPTAWPPSVQPQLQLVRLCL